MPVLVTSATCPHCRRARGFLALHGVSYDEIPSDTAKGRALLQATKSRGVPLLVTDDGVTVVGFQPTAYMRVLGLRVIDPLYGSKIQTLTKGS